MRNCRLQASVYGTCTRESRAAKGACGTFRVPRGGCERAGRQGAGGTLPHHASESAPKVEGEGVEPSSEGRGRFSRAAMANAWSHRAERGKRIGRKPDVSRRASDRCPCLAAERPREGLAAAVRGPVRPSAGTHFPHKKRASLRGPFALAGACVLGSVTPPTDRPIRDAGFFPVALQKWSSR